jgi:dihydrofolate reductase
MLKPTVSLVVAMNNERVIGVNNQLPWHVPEDLQHFKQVTMGKPIIMGRKTFLSIGRVLPGRSNIVISRDFVYPGVEVYSSVEAALASCQGLDEVCIIGGGELFKSTLSKADKLYLTILDIEVVGEEKVFFPEVVWSNWQLVHETSTISSAGVKCSFREYIKIR